MASFTFLYYSGLALRVGRLREKVGVLGLLLAPKLKVYDSINTGNMKIIIKKSQ